MSLPQIRACTADDAAALSLVAKATFLETFSGVLDGKAIISQCENVHSSASYASQLENSTYRFWLAAVDPGGAPVGFTMVSNPDLPVPITAHDIELKRIYLLSKFQGGGTGKRLLAEAIHYARSSGANRLLLGVYAGNVRAKDFYLAQGFEQIGSRTFDVGGVGYDDHILALSLNTYPLVQADAASRPHTWRQRLAPLAAVQQRGLTQALGCNNSFIKAGLSLSRLEQVLTFASSAARLRRPALN